MTIIFCIASLLGVFLGFIVGFAIWIKEKTNTKPNNRLSYHLAEKYRKDGYCIISPEGDTQDFIFGPIGNNASCGDARFGITLDAHRYDDKYKGVKYESWYGGVVGLKDLIRLRDHLNKHIARYQLGNETKDSSKQVKTI